MPSSATFVGSPATVRAAARTWAMNAAGAPT
jgi:hypothetical protein